MANQTVYPYGTGGELPSSIGIINDLTTGGVNKALSAEMGKTLNGNLTQLGQEVRTNFIQYVGWMSGATGAYTNASTNSFIVIPISTSGVKYIVRKGANNVQMAFLKSFDGIPASTFDITGTKLSITTDSAEGMIPTNAKYIYLLRKYNGNLWEIPSIIIDGIDITKPISTEVGNLADNIRESLNSGYKKYRGWMSANDGTYTDINTNLYMVFHIQPGARYSFTKNASNNNHLAFLKTFSGSPESAFDISGQRIVLTNATPVTGVVPSDANYLYVLVQYNNTAWGLPSIEINGVDVTKDIEHRIFLLGGYLLDAIDDVVGNEDEQTSQLLAVDANAYYINTNYFNGQLIASENFRVSNPFYLRAGDKVKVISPAMGFSNGRAVLAKTDSPVFDAAKMKIQAIDITPTGTGYDTTYNYTVTEAGYYIVSWASQYSQAKAYITFAERDDISKNTEDIGINAGKISKLEEMSIGPITNVFGDILPKNFRDKFFGSIEDMEVVCVGDSLTGLVDYSGVLDAPEHQAPGMLYKHWTYQLWDRLCLNKPVCDRLDSQRDGADVFTKVGTWTEYVNNTSGDYGDYSVTANTYKSNSADASVSFVLDLDDYEKCNIVFSANPDGALAEIAITEGNGKLLASLDKNTWVEANGFQVNEGTTNIRERHRRVWMKKASGATGEVTVTFKRSSTDTGSSHYLYCWGTERWNGASLFLTNLGRGGRTMVLLGANRMDIFDRKPDLCIFELPLANETVVGTNTLVSLKVIYHDNLVYLRTLSNDYQDTEFLFVLPTGRTQYFSGNQAVEYVSSGTATMKNHLMAKAIFGYVAELTKDYRNNVGMVNLTDQVYNEGLVRGYTLQGWLASDSLDVPTITRDGVHLNNLGSSFWAKYLSGIFQ